LKHVIDLPFPISVNNIWKKGPKGFYLSAPYSKWIEAADQLFVMNKIGPLRTIEGKFIAVIELHATGKKRKTSDCDNLAKVCLDYAQRTRLIENDRLAQWVTIGWVDEPSAAPPYGARLTILPWDQKEGQGLLPALIASLAGTSREKT
jgi:Holliday junction resolvase RusA-like endonuclease